jgi:cation transport ATPase
MLVLDKTGTLTEGRPKVVHIEAANGYAADDVLQKLTSVERASEHPLALAIVTDALERKLAPSPVVGFDSPVGKGVVGTVDGQLVVSGSGKFLAEHGINVSGLDGVAEEQRSKAAFVSQRLPEQHPGRCEFRQAHRHAIESLERCAQALYALARCGQQVCAQRCRTT